MSVYEKMTAIANAIRRLTHSSEPLTLDGIAEGISNVYNSGKQAENESFWNYYQKSGNRSNHEYAFSGYVWVKTIFKPLYDIRPTSGAEGMFQNSRIAVDLVEHLGGLGVTLDLSQATGINKAFQKTDFTRVGLIDTTNVSACTQLFNGSATLVTIDTLKCKYTNTWSSAFTGCTALANITIDGEIGKAVSFADCKNLTHGSLMSIIDHLRTVTTTITLTLGTTNLAKLTDAEKAIATEKGWTLA